MTPTAPCLCATCTLTTRLPLVQNDSVRPQQGRGNGVAESTYSLLCLSFSLVWKLQAAGLESTFGPNVSRKASDNLRMSIWGLFAEKKIDRLKKNHNLKLCLKVINKQ